MADRRSLRNSVYISVSSHESCANQMGTRLFLTSGPILRLVKLQRKSNELHIRVRTSICDVLHDIQTIRVCLHLQMASGCHGELRQDAVTYTDIDDVPNSPTAVLGAIEPLSTISAAETLPAQVMPISQSSIAGVGEQSTSAPAIQQRSVRALSQVSGAVGVGGLCYKYGRKREGIVSCSGAPRRWSATAYTQPHTTGPQRDLIHPSAPSHAHLTRLEHIIVLVTLRENMDVLLLLIALIAWAGVSCARPAPHGGSSGALAHMGSGAPRWGGVAAKISKGDHGQCVSSPLMPLMCPLRVLTGSATASGGRGRRAPRTSGETTRRRLCLSSRACGRRESCCRGEVGGVGHAAEGRQRSGQRFCIHGKA